MFLSNIESARFWGYYSHNQEDDCVILEALQQNVQRVLSKGRYLIYSNSVITSQ